MSVSFYFDVHVPRAIGEQLRLRDVSVLTAQDDDAATLPDDQLLLRAAEVGRVMFTQDHRFRALAEQWLREQRWFAGLLFAQQYRAPVGDLVRDLELIAKASDPPDWWNVVEFLPLK